MFNTNLLSHQEEFIQKQQNASAKDEETENLKKEIHLSKQTQNENKHCQFQTALNENNKNETKNSKKRKDGLHTVTQN